MNFFEKLLLARQISFTDGEIKLLGQRSNISSPGWISLYTLSINTNTELLKKLYLAAKRAMIDDSPDIKDYLKANKNNYSQIFFELGKLIGWGNINLETFDEKTPTGVMTIENPPVGLALKGKVNTPCDHVTRGLLAGIGVIIYKKEIDVIETECIAINSTKCTFTLDLTENLKLKYPKEYSNQII